MDVASMIAGVGLTLFLAKLAEELVLRYGLPGLLGPLSVGILLSHTPLKNEYYFSPFLFLVGMSFTSFLLGAGELAYKLLEVDRKDFLKGVVLFAVPFVVATAILYPFVGPRTAALIGSTMAMSSTPRLYGVLSHVGLLHEAGDALIASSVSEVAGLIVVQYLTTYNILTIVAILILIVFFVEFGKRLFRRLMKLEEDFTAKELPLSLLISITISVSYLSELLGFNNAVMSLLLGVLAAEYLAERPWIRKRYAIITHSFFEPLFFVGAGLSVTFNIDPKVMSMVVLANFATVVTKLLLGKAFKWKNKVALASAIKGGIDSALLASAWRRGVLPSDLFSAAILTITLNTFVLASFFRGKKRGGYVRACDLELDRAALDPSEPLSVAYEMLKTREAVVVVDVNNWPIGYLTATDLLRVPFEELDQWRVIDVYREGVPVIYCDEPINKILSVMEEDVGPVIAVVKEHIGYVGSLYPVQVLKLVEKM